MSTGKIMIQDEEDGIELLQQEVNFLFFKNYLKDIFMKISSEIYVFKFFICLLKITSSFLYTF